MTRLKRRLWLWIRSFFVEDQEGFAPHGVPIRIPATGDVSVRYLLARGRPYEEAEANMVKTYLEADTSVIELGGCFGVISALIRNKIGPNARHVIVEAKPDLAAVCEENARQGGIAENTEVVVAAIDYSGAETVKFARGRNAHVGRVTTNAKASIDVPTVTLSKLVGKIPEGPFALVCDIEGAEVDLFQNEQELLSRLSLLVLETHPDITTQTALDDMVDLITTAGLREVARADSVICFMPG